MTSARTVAEVTVRFWAGAKRAAGRTEQTCHAATLGDLLVALAAGPDLAAVLDACTFLVDGTAATPETPLADGAVVDVLPPFAGG